jgi:hypothetical protein
MKVEFTPPTPPPSADQPDAKAEPGPVVATARWVDGSVLVEADDPEVAALPAEARAMARQQLQQIAAETDAARLREGIAQLTAASGQVPPEMKPVFDLLLKRAQERLSVLEGGQK